MKRLFTYIVKRTLLNPNLIGWGILYIVFWGIIGAYIMAPGFLKEIPFTNEKIIYQNYVAVWYSDLVILSLSALAVSIAFILFYQTGTLPYLLRYSKLKASTYVLSIYLGFLVVGLIIELLMTAVIPFMFSNNGTGIITYPSEIPTLIPILILGSLFFISFSTFLAIITIKFKGMRMQNLISFIPLILGFIFYSLFTFSEYPNILDYTSPYLSMMLLLYYGYTGNIPPINFQNAQERVSVDALILSSVLWTLIITIIDIIMIRRIYFTNIEESRQL
ncbi:hypothetical protein J5U23_01962 [Saccharolobus shibatae B12]|uniref:Uncharacterized protein n=1 Tax=Saccharolobus shibatae (strain ATCC 51178 / DSM 5389 / JCM 8931 / NBRC 15437 / B12) TaxID=523848 RepID=A0A8F5BPU8_SACSH|nr:hypothetical protein [Saccharolobus shibatae]QXJ29093.1 hypothetical protein J5U23_01962 [Saccharolobus shibatae B12]